MAETADLDPQEVFTALGTPVVRKFRKSSGGKGLQILHKHQQYVPGWQGNSILERFVDAPEASIESFIDRGSIRFTNITKYHRKGHCNFVPAALEPALDRPGLHHECDAACLGLQSLGGISRNGVRREFSISGTTGLICGSGSLTPRRRSRYRGAWQGARAGGRWRAGFRVKVKPGDEIDPRSGLGQDAGYVVHTSPTPDSRSSWRLPQQSPIESILHEKSDKRHIAKLPAPVTVDSRVKGGSVGQQICRIKMLSCFEYPRRTIGQADLHGATEDE